MLQLFSTERGKVVHAMKAFRGSRGMAILIHNLGTKWRWVHQHHAPAIYLQGRIPVPIEEEGGRAPEPLWMIQRREKSLASVRIWTLDSPAHSLVTILIVLYWLKNLNWCTLLLSLLNTEYSCFLPLSNRMNEKQIRKVLIAQKFSKSYHLCKKSKEITAMIWN